MRTHPKLALVLMNVLAVSEPGKVVVVVSSLCVGDFELINR